MLCEYEGVRQHPGEAPRRLFWDEYFHLYVWQGQQGEIIGFELSYDLLNHSRAFRWTPAQGTEHFRVDDGEDRAMKKGIPVLRADRAFVDPGVLEEFTQRSSAVESRITQLVLSKLEEFLTSHDTHHSA